jgi:hypothetical protein
MYNTFLGLPMGAEDSLLPLRDDAVNYRINAGLDTGKKVIASQTLPAKDEQHYSQLAQINSFSLHAGGTGSRQTDDLKRLRRYIARLSISDLKLSLTDSGKVRYALKTHCSNCATYVFFSPLDCVSKLAALVPPYRLNLTRF